MNKLLALLGLSILFLISSEIDAASPLLRPMLKKSAQNNVKCSSSRARLSSASSTETAPSKSYLKSIGTVTGLSLLGSVIAYKHQEAYENEAEEIHDSIISNQKIDLPRVSLPFLIWETSLGKASLYEIALKQENFFRANLLLRRTAGLMMKNNVATKENLSAEKDYIEFLDEVLSGKIENLAAIPLNKLTKRLRDGRNLISIAVETKNFALVEKLVERGVYLVSGEENPILCSSDQELNLSILQDVLAGKSVDISAVSSDVLEHIDSDGQSIFKAAVLRKDFALMKQLVDKSLNYYRDLLRKNLEQADFEKDLFSKQMKVLNSQVKDLSTVPLKVLNKNMPDGRSLIGTALSSFKFGIVAQLLQRGVDFRLLDLTRKAAFVHKTITYEIETKTKTQNKYLSPSQMVIDAISNKQDFSIIKAHLDNGKYLFVNHSHGGRDMNILPVVYLEKYENKDLADIKYLHERGVDFTDPELLFLAKQQHDFTITTFILGEFIKSKIGHKHVEHHRAFNHINLLLGDILKFRAKYDKKYLIDSFFPGEKEYYEMAFQWISNPDWLAHFCREAEIEIGKNYSKADTENFTRFLQKLYLQKKSTMNKQFKIYAAISVQQNFDEVVKKLIEEQEGIDWYYSSSNEIGEGLLECYVSKYEQQNPDDIEYIVQKWGINLVSVRMSILKTAITAGNIEGAICILRVLAKKAADLDSGDLNTIIGRSLNKFDDIYHWSQRNDPRYLEFLDLAFDVLCENCKRDGANTVELFCMGMDRNDKEFANYLRNLYWKKLYFSNKKAQ